MSKGLQWADMLARIGSANARLSRFLIAQPGPPRVNVAEQIDQERSRIARELHAGAGQPLSAMKLHLELLSGAASQQNFQESVSRLQTLADSALEQVRAVSHRLHPPQWQMHALPDALRGLIAQTGLDRRYVTRVEIPETMDVPYPVRIALYRCAQECLSNLIRHSGARTVSIELKMAQTCAQLRIADDGTGLAADGDSDGMGLRAIRHYAGELHGHALVESNSAGTAITVSIPLVDENPD